MFGILQRCRSAARRHPWICTVTLGVVCVGALAAGWHAWVEYQFNAAKAALAAEHYGEARKRLWWCRILPPRHADAYVLSARVERMVLNFPEAEAYLKEAAKVHGGATSASQVEWLLLRCQRGEIDELAPGLWTSIRNGDPESEVILETMARYYMHTTRFTDAMACVHQWLKLDPSNVRALDAKGWLLEAMQDPDSAAMAYQEVLEAAPDRATVRMRLVDIYLREINPDKAYEHLQILKTAQGDNPAYKTLRARYLALMGEAEKACQILDEVHAARPGDPVTAAFRAKLEMQLQRPAEAETWVRRTLKINPHDAEAQFTLYRSLKAQGRTVEAERQKNRYEETKADLEALHKLLRRSPAEIYADPTLSTETGRLFLKLGRDEGGKEWLYNTLRHFPSHRRAHAILADYYEQRGESELARKHREAL